MTETLKTLSSDQLTPIIYQRQEQDYQSVYSYFLDCWFFSFNRKIELTENEAVYFDQVRENIDRLLAEGSRLAYWSGGFDLGYHTNTISTLKFYFPEDVKIVVGIEPDSYIKNKGREPQFDQMTRLSAVGLLAKREEILGLVFPIPEREGRDPAQFYDQLVKKTGMYRRLGCYHLYTSDDPAGEIKKARMIKPESWCCLQLIRDKSGRHYSTTRLLGLEK